MSKIFEALQFAQTERTQRDKLVRQVSNEAKHTTQVLEPEPVSEVTTESAEPAPCHDTQVLAPSAVPEVRTQRVERNECNCEQLSHRIRRQGVWDFLLGLFGLYPWKCSQCHRRFHRSRRY
jgi:hypothetical protein